MSKKMNLIGIICIPVLLIILLPAVVSAEQYYDQYPGNGFLPYDESSSYMKSWENTSISHDDAADRAYICPVNFNVPDGSTYFIKSIGICYLDTFSDGSVSVYLRRRNLYTGAVQVVASWTSGISNASALILTASKGTNLGFKLVDTKKFAYWLYVYFWLEGAFNPSSNLRLYQVRIHYGT